MSGDMAGMDGHEAVSRYVAQQRAQERFSEATARQTRYLLNAWVCYADDWRDPDIDEVVDWVTGVCSKDGKHRRESALRCFLRWSVARGYVRPEVVGWVPTICGSGKAPKPIPDRVLAQAMAHASHRDRQAMVLGRFAGLRASEIAGVHRDHLAGGRLYVLGKGGKERWVMTHPLVVEVIESASGFVFPSDRSDCGHALGQTMSVWLGDALPCPWTAHSLRHAFATELYAVTRDLVLVAEQLGHASTRTTERYVKSDDERAARAVAGLRLAA